MRFFILVRKLIFIFLKHHYFFISLAAYLSIYFFSALFSYSIEHDHATHLMHLHPPLEEMLDDSYVEGILPKGTPPFYTEFTKHPSFTIKSYNDLLGHIDIYKLKGLEKLERSLFYNKLDYAVTFIATNFVVDSGEVMPKEEHCALIFRTLIHYCDQSWQSNTVHSIHRALEVLNDELIHYIVEYYAFDKYNTKKIAFKDFNLLALKHSFVAEAVGLGPVDFAWGNFTPAGLDEYKYYNTWFTALRKESIKQEMLLEYIFYDVDLIMAYLERKIGENVRIYSHLMAQKLAIEAMDLKMLGKKDLTYKEMVHYRTYDAKETLYRYGHVKAYINASILLQENITFFRDFEAYQKTFDPDANKGFYKELSDKVEIDMARKRQEYSTRLFHKK